jgi:ketosteroid isomerase-like protein
MSGGIRQDTQPKMREFRMTVDAKVSEAIDTAERQFIDAIQKGDFDAASSVFGEDAVLMPPRAETVLGRPNIKAFWGRGRRVRGVMLTPSSRKTLGPDLVREVGAMRLSTVGPKERARELSCKYAFIWQLVGDLWTIETCVWNRVSGSNAGNQQPRLRGGGGRLRGGAQAGGQEQGGRGRVRGGGAAMGGAPGRFQPADAGGSGAGGGGQGQRRFQGGGRSQGEAGDGQSGGRFQGGRRFQGGAGGGQRRNPARGQDPFGSDFDK